VYVFHYCRQTFGLDFVLLGIEIEVNIYIYITVYPHQNLKGSFEFDHLVPREGSFSIWFLFVQHHCLGIFGER
jgi:hypothetical protein